MVSKILLLQIIFQKTKTLPIDLCLSQSPIFTNFAHRLQFSTTSLRRRLKPRISQVFLSTVARTSDVKSATLKYRDVEGATLNYTNLFT